MVRHRLAILGLLFGVAYELVESSQVAAQEPTEVSGSLLLDKRFLATDWWSSNPDASSPQVGFYSKAELKLQRWLSENLQVVASAQFRFFDYSTVTSPDGLSDPSQQMTYQFFPWEIFIRAHGVLLDGLDLSLGKQRIAWGKADKLNPTDTLNPDDFTDIFDFGAHVPSTAAVATYNFPYDVNLTAAWIPAVRPILTSDAYPQVKEMASARQQTVLLKSLPVVPGVTIAPGTNSVAYPTYDLKHSMQAVRVEGSIWGIDLSLSYFRGYEDIPVISQVNVLLDATLTATINSTSGFMPFQQVGLDMATELEGVGLWAEAALVIPDGVETLVVAPTSPDGQKVRTLSGEPYAKFTVGGDYTFEGNFYINIQYAHGLSNEIDKNQVGEYIVGKLQKKFFEDTLVVSLNGGYATPDWAKASDQYGYLVNPEIVYKAMDNLELLFGAYLVEGEGEESLFSTLDSADQVYLKAKASF